MVTRQNFLTPGFVLLHPEARIENAGEPVRRIANFAETAPPRFVSPKDIAPREPERSVGNSYDVKATWPCDHARYRVAFVPALPQPAETARRKSTAASAITRTRRVYAARGPTSSCRPTRTSRHLTLRLRGSRLHPEDADEVHREDDGASDRDSAAPTAHREVDIDDFSPPREIG